MSCQAGYPPPGQQQAYDAPPAYPPTQEGGAYYGQQHQQKTRCRSVHREDYYATATADSDTAPPIRTPGSRQMAIIGFIIMLLSASAGIHFGAGGSGLLLCFTGVLAGANLVAVGVRMDDHPVVLDGACAQAPFKPCKAAAVGLAMASCAVTTVPGEAHPVLCFGMLALLLVGVSLINVGVRGE